MNIKYWYEIVQDREKWRDVEVTAKTFREQYGQKKKEEEEEIR